MLTVIAAPIDAREDRFGPGLALEPAPGAARPAGAIENGPPPPASPYDPPARGANLDVMA